MKFPPANEIELLHKAGNSFINMASKLEKKSRSINKSMPLTDFAE
jgi:hypothetical protein